MGDRLARWLRSRSAPVVLLAMWLFWLGVQFVTGMYEATAEALDHGGQFEWGPFLVNWTNKVAENNASEMFQVVVAAWAFKHLLYTGSPESRDTDDDGTPK